jgi:molybdenum cofactor cytidylyltransferase
MIFGRLPTKDAEGAILAHTTRLPGQTLPKGALLTPAAIQALIQAGYTDIIAARLETDDVAENEAAARLAAALTAPGITPHRATHGRANLAATQAGLFRADAAAITALNRLDEGLTIATLPDATPVQPGTLLVTVKIIPFAIAGAVLARAERLAAAAPPLRLPPFQPLRTGLVLTELPGLKESIFEGTIDATRQRITALGGALLPPRRTPHTAAAIAAALRALLAEGADLLLIAGASAAVDRLDEGPDAIVLAGGSVTHFGMPVDPGNLICLGEIGAVPALVLPGCARSPSLNGIDLVLSRIFAGEPAGAADIAALGVGGLLKDFAARPAPRAQRRTAPPQIAALILAAGLSSRMAPANKLLLPDATGTSMVARVADAALASRAHPVMAVLGHQAEAVTAALGSRALNLTHAENYRDGLSASLRAGLAALPDTVDAVIVCLADMPLVTPAQINDLIDAYDPDEGRLIVVPTHQGKRGNPVLWDRRFFAEMSALSGDTGARGLLLRHAEHVAEHDVGTPSVLQDFDTREALEKAGPTSRF